MMRSVLVIVILSLSSIPADAAWIVYRASDAHILAARENESDVVLKSGQLSMELAGYTVATIPWPVPPGCTAGKPRWTKIEEQGPGEPPLGLDVPSDVHLFSADTALLVGCHKVDNVNALWRVVKRAIRDGMEQDRLSDVKADLNIVALELCPASDTSPDCDSIRAKIVTLNNIQAGQIAAFSAFLDGVQALIAAANAFAAGLGWGP